MFGISRKNWFFYQSYALFWGIFVSSFFMLFQTKLGKSVEIPVLSAYIAALVMFISDIQRAKATDSYVPLAVLTVLSYLFMVIIFSANLCSWSEMLILLLLIRAAPFAMLATFPSISMHNRTT